MATLPRCHLTLLLGHWGWDVLPSCANTRQPACAGTRCPCHLAKLDRGVARSPLWQRTVILAWQVAPAHTGLKGCAAIDPCVYSPGSMPLALVIKPYFFIFLYSVTRLMPSALAVWTRL